MSTIIDVNKCYYKYIIKGSEMFDCFTPEEQETIMNALGFEFNTSLELADEINSEPKVLYDIDRNEYRSNQDEPWNPEITYAKIYDNIDQAFGDICEPYVVDYFDGILENDLGKEVPEGIFEEYDLLRKIVKLIDDEKRIDTDGETSNMDEYLSVYKELFTTVCLFDKEGKELYAKILREISEKVSTINSVVTTMTVVDVLQDLGFKLCQKDKSFLSKMVEREIILNKGLQAGKLNVIASCGGPGKSRHASIAFVDEGDVSLRHPDGLPMEITPKFFNKFVSNAIKEKGISVLKHNEDILLKSIEGAVHTDIPRQALKTMHDSYYGVSGDRRNHKEKVEESNKHFKSFAEKNKRK